MSHNDDKLEECYTVQCTTPKTKGIWSSTVTGRDSAQLQGSQLDKLLMQGQWGPTEMCNKRG